MKTFKLMLCPILSLFFFPIYMLAQNATNSNDGEKHIYGGITISDGFFRSNHADGDEINTSQSDFLYFTSEVFGTYVNKKDVYYTIALGYGRGRNIASGSSEYSYGQGGVDFREFEHKMISEDYLFSFGMGKQFEVGKFKFLPGAYIGYNYQDDILQRNESRYYDGDKLVLERIENRDDIPLHVVNLQMGGQAYYAISGRLGIGLEAMVNTIEVSYSRGKYSGSITIYDRIANITETESFEGYTDKTLNVGFPLYEEFGISLRYRLK